MERAGHSLVLPDLAATRSLAARLAGQLQPGDVVLLEGDLGAGKTEFARSVIQAVGGSSITVPSPTFTLLQSYDLPGLEVGHADLYRVGEPDEIAELGLEECWARGALLVEWPERAPWLWPAERLAVALVAVPGAVGARHADLTGTGRWAALLAALADGVTKG